MNIIEEADARIIAIGKVKGDIEAYDMVLKGMQEKDTVFGFYNKKIGDNFPLDATLPDSDVKSIKDMIHKVINCNRQNSVNEMNKLLGKNINKSLDAAADQEPVKKIVYPELSESECKSMLKAGRTVTEIAAYYGKTKDYLYKYLNTNGISPKQYRKP